MIKNNQIGYRELLTLLIILITGKMFLSFPRDMTLLGGTAGWLLVVLSGIFSLGGFMIIYALLRRFPDDNIFEITRRLTGNWIGALLGIVIFLYFLAITTLMVRQFAESFILAILPRTPISVITLFFLIMLMYATFLGIETITRTAWFLGPYLLAGVIAIALSAVHAQPDELLPIFGTGPSKLLTNAVIYISSFSEIILLAIVAPLVRKKEKLFRIGVWSILFATLILSGITAITILTFNYRSASHLIFPVFQLTRLINLGSFLQRVDALFVFLWFITAGIQSSALFYGTVISFSESFQIRNYRPLVFPLATLIFILSLLPQSMPEAVNLDTFVIGRYYSVVWVGIPLLLWLIAVIFKKRADVSNA